MIFRFCLIGDGPSAAGAFRIPFCVVDRNVIVDLVRLSRLQLGQSIDGPVIGTGAVGKIVGSKVIPIVIINRSL